MSLADVIGPKSELRPYLDAYISGMPNDSVGMTALRFMLETSELGGTDEDVVAAAKFVRIGYQGGHQIQSFGPENRFFGAIADWIGSALPTRPLANVCKAACSADQAASCLVEGFGIIGGYYEAIRFDSPSETFIPQHIYLESRRAQGMITRRLQSARADADVPIFGRAELTSRSACLASVVFPK